MSGRGGAGVTVGIGSSGVGAGVVGSTGEGSGRDGTGASFRAQPPRNSPKMSKVVIPIDKTLLFDHM
ncbi:hypothetical protein ES703_80833 [subsurface metagenome]